jgi:mono/diheme cytochrome c family protein
MDCSCCVAPSLGLTSFAARPDHLLKQNQTNRRKHATAGTRATNYVVGMRNTYADSALRWLSMATRQMPPRWRVYFPLCAVVLVLPFTAANALATGTGDYTSAQSTVGRKNFNQSCSSCHGSDLQGQAGPALAGPAFAKSLQFSKMSASQLYGFISKQMPADDPGSLSEDQYLRVLAYILSKNGYPSGQTRLSKDTLSQVVLLPYPGSESSSHARK